MVVRMCAYVLRVHCARFLARPTSTASEAGSSAAHPGVRERKILGFGGSAIHGNKNSRNPNNSFIDSFSNLSHHEQLLC